MVIPNPVHPFVQDAHFRKWAWADEWGWVKSIHIPLCDTLTRYPGNPIFSYSGVSGTFDETRVNFPCPLRRDKTYWLFYCGASAVQTGAGLGVAYSNSPTGPFTRSVNNPLISPEAGTWKDRVFSPATIYDVYEPDPAKKWKMMYVGENTARVAAVGYAYAPGPEGPWTEYAGNPVYTTDLFRATSFIRFGKLYYLAVPLADRSAVKVLYSEDCVNWTLWGNIFTVGGAGEPDQRMVNYCNIFWNLGTFFAFYMGIDAGGIRHFMIALTINPLSTYTKWAANPVLDDGASTDWDYRIMGPIPLMVEEKFYIYYMGADTNWVQQIGAATIP